MEHLTASFSCSCGGGSTCDLDGGGSTSARLWNWKFGDGGSASGVTVSHPFGDVGDFVVTLTVGDGTNTASQQQTVSCAVEGRQLRCR